MNIEIDDMLLDEVLKRTGSKTVQQIVDEALKSYLRKIHPAELANLKGKITWVGNLDEMRKC